MNWLSRIIGILIVIFQHRVYALEPFDPYNHDESCTASMSTCSFELHATATMTMFYKNLFRVIADENGTLYHYNDHNQTFPMAGILTADGYPKLVWIFLDILSEN